MNDLDRALFLFGLLAQAQRVFSRAQLSADEMYVLVYVRSFGKSLRSQKIVLRNEITKVLKVMFDFSDSAVSKCLNDLLMKNFLSMITLNDSDLEALIGTRTGRRKALVLTKQGQRKTDQFAREMDKAIGSIIHPNSQDLTVESVRMNIERIARYLENPTRETKKVS